MRARTCQPYPPEIEAQMRAFYDSLSEKDRRRYAALEALKLGHGGRSYIASIFGCDRHPLADGLAELNDPEVLADPRIRVAGGGRKPAVVARPDLDRAFLQVVADYTAGSPMKEDLKWTNLRAPQIADYLAAAGHPVSVPVVEGLLQRHGFGKRQARKMKSAGEHAERNAQFERISEHKAAFATGPNPLLSMDSKKKELVGNFWRKGELWTKEVVKTLDHDFPSLASGVVIPHGLYDLRANLGYVSLGTSSDTSEFAVESMLGWWGEQGRALYPEAAEILLLCDGGGSNSARTYLFKQDLLRFTATTGLRVRVAHYPPYTSKWNPIEHRLFPHLTRACAGVVLTSVGLVRELMSGAKTATGLEVTVKILDKVYEKGRQVAEAVKEEIRYQAGQVREKARIVYDEKLPRWNYRVFPRYVNVGDVI